MKEDDDRASDSWLAAAPAASRGSAFRRARCYCCLRGGDTSINSSFSHEERRNQAQPIRRLQPALADGSVVPRHQPGTALSIPKPSPGARAAPRRPPEVWQGGTGVALGQLNKPGCLWLCLNQAGESKAPQSTVGLLIHSNLVSPPQSPFSLPQSPFSPPQSPQQGSLLSTNTHTLPGWTHSLQSPLSPMPRQR